MHGSFRKGKMIESKYNRTMPYRIIITISKTINRNTTSAPPEQKEHKMPHQPDHPTLLIPGPIEFDDAVLTDGCQER